MKVAGETQPLPLHPLGERVVRAQPPAPEWQPVPQSPHIEVNRQGQLRTHLPMPK